MTIICNIQYGADAVTLGGLVVILSIPKKENNKVKGNT